MPLRVCLCQIPFDLNTHGCQYKLTSLSSFLKRNLTKPFKKNKQTLRSTYFYRHFCFNKCDIFSDEILQVKENLLFIIPIICLFTMLFYCVK